MEALIYWPICHLLQCLLMNNKIERIITFIRLWVQGFLFFNMETDTGCPPEPKAVNANSCTCPGSSPSRGRRWILGLYLLFRSVWWAKCSHPASGVSSSMWLWVQRRSNWQKAPFVSILSNTSKCVRYISLLWEITKPLTKCLQSFYMIHDLILVVDIYFQNLYKDRNSKEQIPVGFCPCSQLLVLLQI